MPENLHGATIDRVNKEKCQECCWLESETGEGISRIEGCTVKDTYIETTKYGSRINFEDRCIRYSFSMCSNAGKKWNETSLNIYQQKVEWQGKEILHRRTRMFNHCMGNPETQQISVWMNSRRTFIVETDHCGMQYLKTGMIRNARVMHWNLAMQNYSLHINTCIWRVENVMMADNLSRAIE